MGAWGTAIFSDDTACDVRDEYRDLIGDGLTGPEATRTMMQRWSSSLNDADEAPVFWLALAVTQWKCGRLEQQVLQSALRMIDDGSDLARWEAGTPDYKKRQTVLASLRAMLESPQPSEKPIRKPFRDSNEWRVGDLISYELLSEKKVIMRVIGHHSDKGGTSPICELLDWTGTEIPGADQLQALSIRQPTKMHRPQVMLGRTSAKQRPDKRLRVLGINQKPTQTPRFYSVVIWKGLDRALKEHFGFE